MIILLSIDRINGKRINKARVTEQEPITLARLTTIHKSELHKLHNRHPELTDQEKYNTLDVNFQYKEFFLDKPDPRFMPKPVCFWCQSQVEPNLTGNMKCKCGREWYDWVYDLNKFNQK